MNETTAARAIARWWRTWRRFLPSNRTQDTSTRGNVRYNGKDVCCPITQDVIPFDAVFKFVTRDGHVYAYSLPDLVQYFKCTGAFLCPCTKEPFTRPTVRRLQNKAQSLGLDARRLQGVFEMRNNIIGQQIERENRDLAIENSCGIVMVECLDLIAELDEDTNALAARLQAYELPEWMQLVDDYMSVSSENCRTMLASDLEKVRRLMRNPLADPHGIMYLIEDAILTKLGNCRNENTHMLIPNFMRFVRPQYIQGSTIERQLRAILRDPGPVRFFFASPPH